MPSPQPTAFKPHNHTRCTHRAMETAMAVCSREKLRMTPTRQKVFEVLLESHRAIGAYEILDRLDKAGFSAQPPVAYRALEFLVEHRFVHRIESLNAYITCSHPDQDHTPNFLICRTCHKVAEDVADLTTPSLQACAKSLGFKIEATVVEAEGLCPTCQDNVE